MSSTFFSSDHHLGHEFVAVKVRGFDSVSDHDSLLAEHWDARVRPQDHIWLLGDLVGKATDLDYALSWLDARPGVKHLVWGNHDPGHPMHSGAHLVQQKYLQHVDTAQAFALRKIRKQRVLLSHFPYLGDPHGDHTELPRHQQWRLPNLGAWLLHGHTHSPVATREGTRQLHIGVDAHDFRPVPLKWVEEQISREGGACNE